MFKCQPKKWLWGLLPLAVLCLCAWSFNSQPLETRLSKAASAQLTSAGADWVTLIMDGRDAKISGEAPDQNAVSEAVMLVADTYGVRRVDAADVSIAKPVVLDNPTVKPVAGRLPTPAISGTWPEGKATTLAVSVAGKTYTLAGDAALTSDGSGNWKLVPPVALADGEYDVDVKITDGRKAEASHVGSRAVIVDSTPPAEPSITAASGEPNQPEISGSFDKTAAALTVTAAGSAFVLGKDKALSKNDSGTWTLAMPEKLEPGSYDVSVSTVDEYGNSSSAKKVGFLVVDAPLPAVVPTVAKVAGFGNTPTLTGTWPQDDGSTLRVTLAGKTYKLGTDSELSSDGAGNWSLTPSAPLDDGTYDVVATVTNAAGLSSTGPIPDVLTVLTTAPAAPTIAKVEGFGNTPKVIGTWPEANGNTLQVRLAGKTYTLGTDDELTSDGSGNWSLTPSSPLKDGTYDVVATATNAAALSSKGSASDEVTVLSTAPVAPTAAKVEGFGNTPTLTGTWPQADGNSLQVTLADKTYTLGTDSELTSDDAGNWSLTPSAPLNDDIYDIVATVTNAAGLSSTGNTPAGLRVLATVPAEPTAAKVEGFGNTPTLTGTWPQDDGNTLRVTLAGKTYKLGTDSELTSDSAGNWSLTPSAPLEDGAYDIVAMVANVAGRSATGITSAGVTVKTSAPVAPTAAKVEGFGNTPTLTGTWPQADGNSLQVTLAGKTYTLGTDSELTSDDAGNWSLTPSAPLKDDIYDIVATVTNAAGLSSTGNTPAGLRVLATVPAEPTAAKVEGFGNTPTLTGTWPQDDGNTLRVTLAGKTYKLGTDSELTSDSSGNWSLTPSSPIDDGTYDIVAMVANVAGRSATGITTAGVTVMTNGPAAPTVAKVEGFGNTPTLTGTWPQADGNSLQVTLAGKTYTLGADSELTSDSSGNWTLIPSSPLDDGTYDIGAVSRNAAGVSSSDGGSTVVRVDTTPPSAPTVNRLSGRSLRPAITGAWDNGNAKMLKVVVNGTSYELAETGALTGDGKGNWILQLDQDLPDGTHDVVAMATDEAGNSSADQSSDEVVVDSIAPAVPTVEKLLTSKRRPTVTGSWASKDTKMLSVLVGAKTYTLEDGESLKADGDNWRLIVDERLEDGIYDVSATATDSVGNIAKYVGKGDLVVDATPPAVPTVNSSKSETVRPMLSGTFPESETSSIAVTLETETFTLGSPSGVSSDGSGNWSVQAGKDYAPGKYDVKVVVTDTAGNTSSDVTIDEIEIVAPVASKEPESPPAPVVAAAVGCQEQINKQLANNTITFRSRSSRIADSSAGLIVKLSTILKQCPDAKIEVGGHTDSRGASSFNQLLSERRANAVRDALVAKGANADNITAVGYGESQPIASNRTSKGQAANRRTAIKVRP